MNPPINYLAVLVAAIVSMILGALWFGPFFGKIWMQLMGFTKESMEKELSKGMGKMYAIQALGSLFMAYVLGHAIVYVATYTKTVDVVAGVMTGFWSWLGFVAPVQVGAQLWEGKSWKLFVLQSGYYLVSLLIMGVILAVWR